MGLFDSLFGRKGGGQFRTDDAHAQNRARQLTMTPMTVAQLRKYGVTDQTQLKLDYFFYTNTEEKAAALVQKLGELGYTGSHELAAGKKKQFVVTGGTTSMSMDDQTVLDWTCQMCDLGREHDCEFDGWGTEAP